MTRLLLFISTNLAVLLVLGTVTQVLGLDRLLGPQSGGLTGLLILAGVVGMSGSFISLALSKFMAKQSTGARVISTPQNAAEAWLVATVARQAERAGIGMPEVAIYPASDLNAFATGMSRDNALVAVSTGLLSGMRREEVEAVLAHEISHVANGDMVTLSLLQGVLNTFVFFFARVVGMFIDAALRGQRNREDGPSLGHGLGYWLAVSVLEMLFGILASLVVMWFSRRREFAADAGAARLENPAAMIAALQRLASGHAGSSLPEGLKAFGIAGGLGGVAQLFTTHPPIAARIEALRRMQVGL